MISATDVRAILTAACPGLSDAFAEEDRDLGQDEERLLYLEIAAAVRQMGRWADEGQTDCFPMLFEAAERCLTDGDRDAVGLILVGLFEDLQNQMVGGNDVTRWEQYLGPVSTRGWQAVADFWEGDIGALDRFRVTG